MILAAIQITLTPMQERAIIAVGYLGAALVALLCDRRRRRLERMR